jgi:hypothetical protein
VGPQTETTELATLVEFNRIQTALADSFVDKRESRHACHFIKKEEKTTRKTKRSSPSIDQNTRTSQNKQKKRQNRAADQTP